MNKLILLTSVAILSFGAISESRAECAAGLIACGDDCAATGATCHWEIDSNGKLSITGSGSMKENFGNRRITENTKANEKYTTAASWGDYYNQITSIEIGEGITDTGARAFQGLSNVTSVNIPKSLTTLGAFSFDRQPDLVNFNVPEGSKLTNFGGNGAFQFSSSLSNTSAQKVLDTISANNKVNGTTFELPAHSFNNSGLTSITIPEGVTSIGNNAFYNASGLTSITIPDSVTSIGDLAFQNATGLTSITLPEGVTSIGRWAFYHATGLTSITIPQGVTSIGQGAFAETTSLTSITLPDSVTRIGDYAFGATGLTSITIPEGVTSIGNYAFQGTNLTSITIPDNINTAGWGMEAFYNIPERTNIVCQGGLNTCYEKLAKYFSADDPRCPANATCNCSRGCIDSSRISEATSASQCTGNYGWSGAGCSRKNADGSVDCASGFVEWDKQCLSEYPFAKKRWTPAEAAQWLHDGNDNFVVITFKK